MSSFLDSVTVIENTGEWTFGNKFPVTYFDRGFQSGLADICAPVAMVEGDDVDFGEYAHPVAVLGYAKAPTRCSPEDFADIVDTAMRNAVEHQVSTLLWAGTDLIEDYDGFLTHPDIATVPRETTHAATVAAALAEAYRKTPHLNPLLHLGFEVAVALGIGLQNLGINYVTAPGYPTDAVAVTDTSAYSGVTVHLSPVETVTAVDAKINRRQVEVTRFAAIEFDRYRAVRAT